MAKLYAPTNAQDCDRQGVQLHGGRNGVRKGHLSKVFIAEIRALRIYEAASDVQERS